MNVISFIKRALQGTSGGAVQVADDQPLPVLSQTMARAINVAFATLTRPANTTGYTANDSISDNATAGSVTALAATVADQADAPLILTHITLETTDTGLAGKTVRAYVYRADPTASSGVGAGDNAAFSNKRNGLVGTFTGTLVSMSDGAVGNLIPENGSSHYVTAPSSAGQSLWIQYQTLNDFTPSANSTTLIGRIKGFQGRA